MEYTICQLVCSLGDSNMDQNYEKEVILELIAIARPHNTCYIEI